MKVFVRYAFRGLQSFAVLRLRIVFLHVIPTLMLVGCVAHPLRPALPESGKINPYSSTPDRRREVERLLDGSYRNRVSAVGSCQRERRMVFHGGRVEMVESVWLEPQCREIRGQITYRGRVEVGELLVKDASSRPLQLWIDEVEVLAVAPGWAMTKSEAQQDSCELANLAMGDRELVTGRECFWGGEKIRFPRRGEVLAGEIVVNSGQRIQIRHLSVIDDPAGPSVRRGLAGATGDQETLDFERTSL